MGRVMIGSMMLVAGLFLSFIPPFIWGAPLFVIGIVTMIAGFTSTTVSAAKTVVAVSKELSRAGDGSNSASAGVAGSHTLTTPPAPDYDVRKWQTLVELDPVIAAAAETVRPYGARYEAMLAEKFMALREDKAYLQSAVDRVIQIATDEQKAISDAAAAKAAANQEFFSQVESERETSVAGVKIYRMRDGRFLTNTVDHNGCRIGYDTEKGALRAIRVGGPFKLIDE